MKTTNSWELLKWLFWTIVAAYGLGYLITIVWQGEVNVPVALILLVFVIFFYRQLARLDAHLPLKEKKILRRTSSRVIPVNTASGTKDLFLSSVKSIFVSEALQQPQGILYWTYGSYIIREDTAYEWLRKGWKRQTWGEAHPYSCNWMIDQRFHTLSNQTIERGYHEALVTLIANEGLWRKVPTQGASGKILYSPTLCIERFKGRSL